MKIYLDILMFLQFSRETTFVFKEQEKCRVLEEALNVLAKEHHELEQSLASQVSAGRRNKTKSPRFYDTSDDEFYDAFEAGEIFYCCIQTKKHFEEM